MRKSKKNEKIDIIKIRNQNKSRGIITINMSRNFSIDTVRDLKEYELKRLSDFNDCVLCSKCKKAKEKIVISKQ